MLLFFIIFYVPVILTSEVTMQFGPRVYVYNQERISSNLIMAEVLQDFQELHENDRQSFKERQKKITEEMKEADELCNVLIKNLRAKDPQSPDFASLDKNKALLMAVEEFCRKKISFNKMLIDNRLQFLLIEKGYLFKRAEIIEVFEPGKRNQELESFKESIQELCEELDKRNNDTSQK